MQRNDVPNIYGNIETFTQARFFFVLLKDKMTEGWGKALLPKQTPCDGLWCQDDDDDGVDTSLWQFPSTESRGLQAKSFYYTSVWFAPELFHGHWRVFVHHVNSDLSLPLCVLECCTTKFAQQPRTGQNQQTRISTLALHYMTPVINLESVQH